MQLKSSGFSLLEVLVALLLAALAVSALMGAQAAALRSARGHGHRLVAVQLAADLAERLRMSRAGLLSLAAQGQALPYDFAAQAASAEPLATLCDGPQVSCTPLQFMQADAAQWRLLVWRQLPSPRIRVELNPGEASAQIWLGWQESVLPGEDALAAAGAGDCFSGWTPGQPGWRCHALRVSW